MSLHRSAIAVLALAGAVLVACGPREQPSPAAPEPTTPPAAAPAEVAPPPAPIAEPTAVTPLPVAAAVPAKPKPAPPSLRATAPARPPAPAAATAAPAPAPTVAPAPAPKPPAAPAASKVADPGGAVAVPAKAGTTRIGAEKCRMCHKIQFESWSASPHAKRTPPLDCESCHGPGSEYKTLGVMKDPAKAKAAGLVLPDAAFCGRCHKGTVDAAYLAKAHAHKATS